MGKKYKNLTIVFGGSILTVSIILLLSIILFHSQNNGNNLFKISIKSGFTLKEISNLLYKKNTITNKRSFEWAARIMGKEKAFPVGTFKLVNAHSNYKIIDQLVNETPEIVKVRILEGWNSREIAGYLSSVMAFDSTKIIELTNDENFISKNRLNVESLEGYYYPDTYFFFRGDTPSKVLSEFIYQYKSFWNNTYKIRAKQLNLTEHEVVTLASIIEGEAIFNDERSKISAVYHNRLNIDMRLQADPTIQYIINEKPRRLYNKDLRIKSPYNTYLNKGLPPGPINSPGKSSLIAALFPETNDFLFFVARGDGYHTFTTNKRDHDKAKKKFQKIRRQLKRKKHK